MIVRLLVVPLPKLAPFCSNQLLHSLCDRLLATLHPHVKLRVVTSPVVLKCRIDIVRPPSIGPASMSTMVGVYDHQPVPYVDMVRGSGLAQGLVP